MIVRTELSLTGMRVAIQDAISDDQIEGVLWADTETRALGMGVNVPASVPSWTIRSTGHRFWRLVDLLTGERVVAGPPHVAWSMSARIGHYVAALDRWSQLLRPDQVPEPVSFAAGLSAEQRWFETHCGGIGLGREVMVVCGIGRFYNTESSFGARLAGARFVVQAFEASDCSEDVKANARHAARFYGLDIGGTPAPERAG